MSEQTEKPVEDEKLIVQEQQDGSVTVEGIKATQDEPDEAVDGVRPVAKAEGGQVPEDGGDDHPDDTEAIRSVRREKRKAKKVYHRQQQVEKDMRYNQLVRQNQDLMTRLSTVERKTHGSELARVDKAIEDHQVRLQYAKMKMAESASANDGEAMANAQEMWYDARQKVEALENLRNQAAQPPKQQAIAPDMAVQRHAADWMERNNWYDPQTKDVDSKIAKVVDENLVSDGYDPRSAEYWEELDNRLQNKLPHRYTGDSDDKSYVKRPRSAVTGSGRESASSSGGRNSFTLSADQVRAMKDAGMWENAELRAKMIKRYANERSRN
jgi:hypothetical protein